VVCLQNGVANEPAALRLFAEVYGVCVVCPASHLEPGVVVANSAPVSGILDVGAFPGGAGRRADEISAAFASATFESLVRDDIMRWKYGKLLNNLGNAVDALCGRDVADGAAISRRARKEGVDVLAAAGIDAVSREEDTARRGDVFQWGGAAASSRQGASSWQSLARGTGSIEADYLNGEIVLLGRLHGVATPVNAVLQREASIAARQGRAPGTMPVAELAGMLPAEC
jgi:2-dehydropantoate 2-reductase